MNFDRDTITNGELINGRPKCRNRAHVLMTGRPVLVERRAALNHRGRTALDHIQIRCADRHSINPHQHFRTGRHRLLREDQLLRIAQHPGPHEFWDRQARRIGLYTNVTIHVRLHGVYP
jgi:hypothetical protein